jgi:hypothetical protein
MISFNFVWRDLWVGAYVAEQAVYVCLIPTLVIKIRRNGRGAPS